MEGDLVTGKVEGVVDPLLRRGKDLEALLVVEDNPSSLPTEPRGEGETCLDAQELGGDSF